MSWGNYSPAGQQIPPGGSPAARGENVGPCVQDGPHAGAARRWVRAKPGPHVSEAPNPTAAAAAPPPPPGLNIDAGIYILLAIGLLYGIIKALRAKA